MGWGIPLDIYANFNRIAGDHCKFWIDTDADVVLDGSDIVSMADQSNAGNNASQSTANRRPQLTTYNGENVVQLQVQKRLDANGVSNVFNDLDVPYSVFNLYLPDTLTGGTLFCIGGSGITSSIDSYFVSGYVNSGARQDIRKEGLVESLAGGIVDITDGGAETDLVLLSEVCDGKNVAFWRNAINDTGAGVPDQFSNPLNAQDLYTVGALRRGAMAATNHCRGKFKIQAVFDIDISDPEREWVQNAIFERRFVWMQ